MAEERACWICLASEGDLMHACNCPEDRVVHRKCLARWQLQSAGKSEEHSCRFCHAVYPSWKESLTPVDLKPAIPVVSVHYNGACYRMQVRPGPQGLDQFRKQLQSITGMSELDCMQITFQCKAPETAQELNFKGITAFDAAIHCASISAAEREKARRTPDRVAKSSSTTANVPASTSATSSADAADPQRLSLPSIVSPDPSITSNRRLAAEPPAGPSSHLPRASQHMAALGHRRSNVTGEQLLPEAAVEPVHAAQPGAAHSTGRLRRMQDMLRGLFM